MRKKSTAQLNYEMWTQCERDMENLQEMILEENYGLAREYGKAEAETELLLSDIRLHAQTAIEEYNRAQRKNPS